MRVLGSDMRLEKLTEIPVFQIFHYHAIWLLAVTGAEDPGDIAILQSSQNPHVSLEVQPVKDQFLRVSRTELSPNVTIKWGNSARAEFESKELQFTFLYSIDIYPQYVCKLSVTCANFPANSMRNM